MIKEISKKEFEKRFPDVSTYDADICLDNGITLNDSEWNGEQYTDIITGRSFAPVYEEYFDDFEIVGYLEV